MRQIFRYTALACFGLLAATASASFVINEIDADTPGTDALEFVELKSTTANESAAGLVLVVYNGGATGGPKVKSATDLGALTSNANGYLIVGNTAVTGVDVVKATAYLENGEEAVALYSGRAASEFPTTAGPTSAGLVDFIVYKASDDGPFSWAGFGQSYRLVREDWYGSVTARSLARIPNGTGTFYPNTPTPDAANTGTPSVAIPVVFANLFRVNQFNATVATSEVLAIRNNGAGPLSVTGVSLEPGTEAVFSLVNLPAFPFTLLANETLAGGVQFVDPAPTANKTYTGSIRITTDNPTTPTVVIPIQKELVRGTTTAAVGAVKVNEILYYPDADWNNDANQANQSDEFVEFFNTTNAPILIEGWEHRFIDEDDVTSIGKYFVFPIGATIPANGYVVVFSGGNPTGFAAGAAFTFNAARLRNTGAVISISDGANTRLDAVAYLDAQLNPGYTNVGTTTTTRGSYARQPDGTDTFVIFAPTGNPHPTPGSTNNVSAASDWMLFQ